MTRALAFLLAAFLPLLLIMMGQSPLLQWQSQLQHAQLHYEEALRTTRMQLAEIGYELKANPALNQDLKDASYSAVSRMLGGYVVPGRIDQLAIIDQNCEYRAHSEQGLLLHADCPLQGSTLEKGQHQTRLVADHPHVEWLMPLGSFGERRLFLVASTVLKEAWIFSFPALRASFRSLDISLGTRPGQAARRILKAEPAALSLYSQHWLLRSFPILLTKEPISLLKPLLLSLLFFVLAFLNVLRQFKRQEAGLKKELDALEQWARDLQADVPADSAETPMPPTQRIRESLNRLVKRNYDQLQSCRQHSHHLSQQMVELETRLLDHQVEQAWLQKARSLHQQMNGAAESHLQKLHEVQSLGDDISHLAAQQLVKPAQRLYELGQRWADELRLVSPRKLVRSLAERVDARGESDLEKAVQTLLEASHALSNSGINITLLTQTLLQELKANIDLARHWHCLMGSADKGSRSLHELITASQSLIKLQEKELQLRYDNQLEPQGPLPLAIPESTLHSVLYHCQMALLELARERAWLTPTLHYQCKKRDDKMILILSLRGPADDDSLLHQLPRAGEQHQHLASQLLQGYGMKITRLPPLQGIQALALIWDERSETQAASRPTRTAHEV